MSALRIIVTADGSHSLMNTELNETYHSHHGALQESLHVFIKNGLEFFIDKGKNPGQAEVNILEVGFGTGLNALLTLAYALQSPISFTYTAIDPFPLGKDIWSVLNYPHDEASRSFFHQLHACPWNETVAVTTNFRLLKVKDLLQNTALADDFFDVIFFDAFAPSKQPEMWTVPVLATVTKAIRAGGVYVTYSAMGQLKRDLRALGLIVETLPGPPGKKQMIRARKDPSSSEAAAF
jgi:tRNA U34 5-methylaminomethyl-2-thiouridine-forming methyltransferase MnmC